MIKYNITTWMQQNAKLYKQKGGSETHRNAEEERADLVD